MNTPNPLKTSVGLFVTCSVDLLRPSVAFAAVKLLEEANCQVQVPAQSCCGQMAYNNGLAQEARKLARRVMEQFEAVDYVVAPSGSCASMLKNHYPRLFVGRPEELRAQQFANKVYELTAFLHDKLQVAPLAAPLAEAKTIAYHDSCSGLRELGIHAQPRQLAQSYRRAPLSDIPEGDVCCGFGGTFCVKFDQIADKMARDKCTNVLSQQPQLLLGGDLPCLLHLAGKLQQLGHNHIEVRHIAEFLAGFDQQPAIGRPH